MPQRSKPCLVAECSIPAYSIKSIGSRHFLVAGGGGGAKTGVPNEIEVFLLTYNQLVNKTFDKLKAERTGVIDTKTFANMNMDVALLGPPQNGKYLVAVGQDKYCALYESVGFCMSDCGDEDSTARLSLQFCGICRWKTDFSTKEPYQKCVKLYRASFSIFIATSGLDGCVRLWDASKFLSRFSKTTSENFCALDVDSSQQTVDEVDAPDRPNVEINVRSESGTDIGDINDLDVSVSGEVLATVYGRSISLWSTVNGRKLATLPSLQQISGSDVRALKFLNLDKSGRNEIFVVVFNKRLPRSKITSYVALFAFDKRKEKCHLITLEKACDEAISALAVSDDREFIAFGTMDGSVGVFTSRKLNTKVYFAKACHSSFVTSVDFLPQRTYDSSEWGRISSSDCNEISNGIPAGQVFLPGVCSGDARAAVLSLSVDNLIQVHQVSYPTKTTFTGFLFRLMIFSCFLYLLLWFLFLY